MHTQDTLDDALGEHLVENFIHIYNPTGVHYSTSYKLLLSEVIEYIYTLHLKLLVSEIMQYIYTTPCKH